MYVFSADGEALLKHLHPQLLRVVRRVMGYQAMDLKVIRTLSTVEIQKQKMAEGTSKTLNSRHLPDENGFAGAVDLAPYPVDFDDVKRFGILMGLVAAAAAEEFGSKWKDIIRLGGNWDGDNDFHDNTPEDPGHVELRQFKPA